MRSALLSGGDAERYRSRAVFNEWPWRQVACGDVVAVPAGSIDAIGAGLVIAEIQQRSDTTFRLFDYARSRALHIEQAVAIAEAGLAPTGPPPGHSDQDGRFSSPSPTSSLKRPMHFRLKVDGPGEARDLVAPLNRPCPHRTAQCVPGRGCPPQG